MTDWLTTAEAAARLGVKPATLYAYVSRGLVHREMDLDGRSSRFDPAEIDRLRDKTRRTATGELATVVATRLTRIAPDGHRYRGRSAVAAATAGDRFETVADALWADDGPWPAMPADAAVEPPPMAPLDRFRIAVARGSARNPMRNDLDPAAVADAGRRCIVAMVASLPARRPVDDGGSLGAHLWARLTDADPEPARLAALDAALVLLADHGLAASTFAVRIAASVRADPYSAVSAGLGALGGQLHGAASAAVHRLLARAAATSATQAVGELLATGADLPGCGHGVYQGVDPRDVALGGLVDRAWSGDERLDVLAAVRAALVGRGERFANVDTALGSFTWLAGADAPAGEAIFAVARTAGWLAHAIEEYAETPLRFRPEARYVTQ